MPSLVTDAFWIIENVSNSLDVDQPDNLDKKETNNCQSEELENFLSTEFVIPSNLSHPWKLSQGRPISKIERKLVLSTQIATDNPEKEKISQ